MPQCLSNLPSCSIQTASILLGRSERTLQRWCEDGTLRVVGNDLRKSQRKLIDLTQILQMFGPCPEPDLAEILGAADNGDATAQNDLGTLLLRQGKAGAAVSFFEEAARRNNPDAMHWLYHCNMNAIGVERNENLALMWLSKAAGEGHVIAKAQAEALRTMALRGLQVSGPSGPPLQP